MSTDQLEGFDDGRVLLLSWALKGKSKNEPGRLPNVSCPEK